MRDPRLSEALPELLRAGLLDPSQVERVRAFYQGGPTSPLGHQRIITTMVGALLVGLGIILLVAHNWDELPRSVRTALAFAPVFLGLFAVGFTLHRRSSSTSWREAGALFLACALCACVALIGQIYHLPGELNGYLLTCSVLMMPLIFLPGSYFVAMAFIALVLWYASLESLGLFFVGGSEPLFAIPLMAVAWTKYLLEMTSDGRTLWWFWMGVFLAIASFVISQLFFVNYGGVQALSVVSVGGVFTSIPWLVKDKELRTGPWVFVGTIVLLWILFQFSSERPWAWLIDPHGSVALRDKALVTLSIGGFLAASTMAYRNGRPFLSDPITEAGACFVLLYPVGLISPGLAALLTNILLLTIGILITRQGMAGHGLRRMNLGLTLIGVLVLLRFFDADIPFLLRGLAFIGIGIAFLSLNLRMMRQRTKHERKG